MVGDVAGVCILSQLVFCPMPACGVSFYQPPAAVDPVAEETLYLLFLDYVMSLKY